MNRSARNPVQDRRRRGFSPVPAALAALLAFCLSAPAAFAQVDNSECIKCHGDHSIASMRPEALAGMVRIPEGQAPVLRSPDQISNLYVNEDALKGSVHAGLACTACHPSIDRLPHPQRIASLSCGDCHSPVEAELASGLHSPKTEANGRRLPVCVDCHGPAHEIQSVREPRSYEQAKSQVLACMQCHADDPSGNHAETYRNNVHGQGLFQKGLSVAATCVDCHGAHAVLSAKDPKSPTYPLNAPQTCGKCHQGIENVFLQSVHGQHLLAGDASAASCTICHESHLVRTGDEDFVHSIVKECAHCHESLAQSYQASYHGKATMLGSKTTAVCSSCHGAHDILPPSDPRSRVAPNNLIATCSQCHQNVNANFVKYIAHVRIRDRAANPQVYWTWLVMTTLLVSVLAVFVPHGLLWFQRSLLDRLKNPRGFHIAPEGTRWVRRFNPVHRFTHLLIVVSFMGLVVTGFPIKYSYTHWAREIADILGGTQNLGLMHRGFALVTFTYAAVHVVFLIWFFWKKCPSPRLRYIIGPDSMLFSLKDLKDFLGMVRWFFWMGPKPKFDRWTYFEKFDYWGEIWGVFLIGGTGMILWFPMLFTRWLPGWIVNCAMVVHSIEALLAASVIFLVHFFNTHIRPEKFPVDMVMLTGLMSEPEMEEERPAEYARLKAEGLLESRIAPPVAFRWRFLGGAIGIMAFLLGMFLIVLALRTELAQVFG